MPVECPLQLWIQDDGTEPLGPLDILAPHRASYVFGFSRLGDDVGGLTGSLMRAAVEPPITEQRD